MKFILGLLIGAGLIFGVYYMGGGSNAELKKADAGTPSLTVEKARIRADYEVQLKAAEDQVENLNQELLKTHADLVAARAKLANIVATVEVSPRLEQPVSKPVVVTVPITHAPQFVSTQPAVEQSAPTQPANVAPVKNEGFRGPRHASGRGSVRYYDGHGSFYHIVNGNRVYE